MPPSQQEATMTAFDTFEYDVDQQEQNCAEAKFSAEISNAKVDVVEDKEDGTKRPRLIVEFRMSATDDDGDAAQQSIGALVSDRFTFYPNGNRKGRFVKERLRTLLDKLQIDHSLLPTSPQTLQDYDDVVMALKGQQVDEIWVTHSKVGNPDDPATMRVFENVAYTEPRRKRNAEEPAEAAPARGGKGVTSKKPAPAKKANGKRN